MIYEVQSIPDNFVGSVLRVYWYSFLQLIIVRRTLRNCHWSNDPPGLLSTAWTPSPMVPQGPNHIRFWLGFDPEIGHDQFLVHWVGSSIDAMSNYNAFALSNYYRWEMLKIGRVLSLPHLNLPIAFLKGPSCHMWMRQVCWKTGGRTIGHNGTGIFYALNWISIAAKRRNCRHSRPTHRIKSQRLRTQTVSTSATPENRIPMLWMIDGYSSNN